MAARGMSWTGSKPSPAAFFPLRVRNRTISVCPRGHRVRRVRNRAIRVPISRDYAHLRKHPSRGIPISCDCARRRRNSLQRPGERGTKDAARRPRHPKRPANSRPYAHTRTSGSPAAMTAPAPAASSTRTPTAGSTTQLGCSRTPHTAPIKTPSSTSIFDNLPRFSQIHK